MDSIGLILYISYQHCQYLLIGQNKIIITNIDNFETIAIIRIAKIK